MGRLYLSAPTQPIYCALLGYERTVARRFGEIMLPSSLDIKLTIGFLPLFLPAFNNHSYLSHPLPPPTSIQTALFQDCSVEVCGPGSSVGIVTGYGLDGLGIECRWGQDFPQLSRPVLGPTQFLYNGHRVFPGVKSGRGVTLTTQPLLVQRS